MEEGGARRQYRSSIARRGLVRARRCRLDAQLMHYENKLAFETDAWDLKAALDAGEKVVIIDARSRDAFNKEHIPGAINVPHRQMNPETTQAIDRDALVVTYCDGIGCNASTKGALKM